MLILAFEGLICIIMASPILIIMVWLGALLGYYFNKGKFANKNNIVLIFFFSSIAFMSFDYVNKAENLIPVKTAIQIDASIETVWENVVTFSDIDEPTEWLFKTGIAYPTHATIKGNGVGAVRYCNFTTGSFVEPITTWNEPYLLAFDVIEQPIPMHEFNPFWEIHPPHLDGYFKSHKGQFELTKISENQTLLEGTTWYNVDIQPVFYWQIWSNFILHSIHERVLGHIEKTSVEKN